MNSIRLNNNVPQSQMINHNLRRVQNLLNQQPSSIGKVSPQPNMQQLRTMTTQQLISMVVEKDEQISQLTCLIALYRQQIDQKSLIVQNWPKQVAQQKATYNLLQTKYNTLIQRQQLYTQVNNRQYLQNLELQKNIATANATVQSLKEQLKVQQSTYAIKLAELNSQLVEEKNTHKLQAKEIATLKAIIKELEQDLESENQSDKEQAASTKNTDQDQTNQDENIIVHVPCIHNKHGSHSLPNSVNLRCNQNVEEEDDDQDCIIFGQA